jgi:hypothetical protein
MPAIVFIVVLVILFVAAPGSVLIPVIPWVLITGKPVEAILRMCGGRCSGDEWAITLWISLFVFAVPASYFSWKWWRVAEGREYYFNLFVLAVGIPAAVIFGMRVTRWQ